MILIIFHFKKKNSFMYVPIKNTIIIIIIIIIISDSGNTSYVVFIFIEQIHLIKNIKLYFILFV